MLRLVAACGVELRRLVVGLYLHVGDATDLASLRDGLQQRPADPLAPNARTYIQVLDAGERSASGDVETISQDGDAGHAVLHTCCEDFEISRLDRLSELACERLGQGLTTPEGFFE